MSFDDPSVTVRHLVEIIPTLEKTVTYVLYLCSVVLLCFVMNSLYNIRSLFLHFQRLLESHGSGFPFSLCVLTRIGACLSNTLDKVISNKP